MTVEKPFRFGIVEGFFGQSWSWGARTTYADFLVQNNFNAYLYAPKNDDYLRKHWHQPFPLEHFNKLQNLATHYANANLDFGIGLSPFELYRDFNAERRTQLKRKLEEINQIKPSTLCILFDDMHGELPDLAQQQAEIIAFVTENSQASNYIMCPSYYSDDVILDKHFGARPNNYLEDLGNLLDPAIDIFWTGPEVISAQLPSEHLRQLAQKLQRKPLLWDNYPVNDSQKLCNFLHLRPPEHRSTALKDLSRGYMANPMNQAFLSQIPLYGIAQIFQNTGHDQPASHNEIFKLACKTICGDELGGFLVSDLASFQDKGLDAISPEQKTNLLGNYMQQSQHPAAREILDWLNNKYLFDPACLT